jgi:hypothetical protein
MQVPIPATELENRGTRGIARTMPRGFFAW